jgi:ApbE superfamily uncharacterized protein (UPF0280 family)
MTQVTVQETDLAVYADRPVAKEAREAVLLQRGYVENYIRAHPEFMHTLVPWPEDPLAAHIVQQMIDAGRAAKVGPMAAVAGAVAECVGLDLIKVSPEIIVENGGDIFIHAARELKISIFAGDSPLSFKIGLELPSKSTPRAVCTSSGTVGHSLSAGRADAVSVLSSSCALADAVATAVANRVRTPKEIQKAIEWGCRIPGVEGLLVILGEDLGAWGQVKIVPLS